MPAIEAVDRPSFARADPTRRAHDRGKGAADTDHVRLGIQGGYTALGQFSG